MKDKFYGYIPSSVVAVAAVLVFGILFLIHLYRLLTTRTWFCIPFIIGAILEILGFLCRAYGHTHHDSLAPFLIQACAILLAPIFFAASVYMFLGRIIRATGCEEYSPIRPSRLTKLFVFGDMMCLNVQSGGSSLVTHPERPKNMRIGKWIILCGLGLQILVFVFFVFVAAKWHSRVRNRPVGKAITCRWNWERYLGMLYAVSVIITIRNLYRVAEYAMDTDGYLMANEWPTYLFDAILMAIVLIICAFWYVGDIAHAQPEGNRESVEMMVRSGENEN